MSSADDNSRVLGIVGEKISSFSGATNNVVSDSVDSYLICRSGTNDENKKLIQKAFFDYVSPKEGDSIILTEQQTLAAQSFEEFDDEQIDKLFDLSKYSSSPDLRETSPDILELYNAAHIHKENGNKFVNDKNYQNALLEYNSAIDLFDSEPIFYCNRALVNLKLKKFDECIEDCDKALLLDYSYKKALYRRMKAFESLNNYYEAFRDCKQLMELEPQNDVFKKCFQRILDRLDLLTPGPKFCRNRDFVDVIPIEMPRNLACTRSLQRISVDEIETEWKVELNELNVSDAILDILFNGICDYVEIKKNAHLLGQQVEDDGDDTNETATTSSEDD